jgi:hypothetical protein
MKINLKILSGLLMLLPVWSVAKDNISKEVPLFKENKGQLVDQDSKLRSDIHYYGSSDGLSYYFKSTGISYQLYEKSNKENEFLVSRVDMTWLGANTSAKVTTKNSATATDNFYTTPNSNGITGVRSFGDLQYEGIYKGIDLHYYYKDGSLKYDFIVAPGANYKNIKIKVEGATSITQNKDASISIVTPNGILTEGIPVTYQGDKEIKTTWILEGNVLSFQLADYDITLPVIIDPLVYQWNKIEFGSGGGYFFDYSFDCSVSDAYGSVYAILYPRSNYSPSSFSNVSRIYKYNSGGASLFGIGLVSSATQSMVRVQGISNYGSAVYVSGTLADYSNLATSGAYQTTIGSSIDGFLIKYDTGGTKLWSTYYGGAGNDNVKSCKADSAGNIFVCGVTQSSGTMASAGAQQSAIAGLSDAFIAKFNAGSGFRTWGTYFGGAGVDSAKSIDIKGNRLFIAGTTQSISGIATVGVLQPTFSGNINGFLLCMDTAGLTQWSTYYGTDSTFAEKCLVASDGVYLSGSTNALTNIATSGSHQPSKGGGFDGFLVKFNVNGVRQWGTYYGGTENDLCKGNALGNDGRIYLCGNTKSASGIATPNSYNDTYSPAVNPMNGVPLGFGSAYIAEFEATGQRVTGTYYNDVSFAEWCSTNNNGDVFVLGNDFELLSNPNPNNHTAFLTRFSYVNSMPIVTATATALCPNMSSVLSTTPVPGATYKWYHNGVAITTAVFTTYTATLPGSYKVVLNNNTSWASAPVVLTAVTAPTTAVAKVDVPCLNAAIGSITITPSGGTAPYSYTWDNATNITSTLSGLIPGNYIVHTSDANTCTKTDTVTILNTNNGPLSLTSQTNVPCYGDSVATITVTTTGGATPYEYAWDNLSNTTAYLDGLGTGIYIVHTTDSNNCSDIDTITVIQNTTIDPSDPLVSICAVTIDSISGKNVILWRKEGNVKATAYNIYRESTVAGQYDLIGTNDVNDPTIFEDATSIPLQQSYSYKIAEVDSCDHEWPMSDLHKTIHLNANVGINGEINLSWNIYEGKPYSTHRILRSFNGGPFNLLNEVSSTITAYSDLTPPIGTSVYRIEIDLGAVCDSLNTQYVTSNKLSLNTTAINDVPGINDIQIVPNPTRGIINILGNKPGKIQLYDAVGRLLLEEKNVNKLDISGFSKGIYMIRLSNKSGALYYSQKILLK